jgi:hypothetical protein
MRNATLPRRQPRNTLALQLLFEMASIKHEGQYAPLLKFDCDGRKILNSTTLLGLPLRACSPRTITEAPSRSPQNFRKTTCIHSAHGFSITARCRSCGTYDFLAVVEFPLLSCCQGKEPLSCPHGRLPGRQLCGEIVGTYWPSESTKDSRIQDVQLSTSQDRANCDPSRKEG